MLIIDNDKLVKSTKLDCRIFPSEEIIEIKVVCPEGFVYFEKIKISYLLLFFMIIVNIII